MIGFTLTDVTVNGGIATSLVDNGGGDFTATVDATADGPVSVSVAAAQVADPAGNANAASNTFAITVDTTEPVPVISGPTGPTNANPFQVAIAFHELVLGFTLADVTVSGGRVTALTDNGGGNFIATIEATADGSVSVSVAADGAEDLAGNSSAGSNTYSLTVDTTPPTPMITGATAPTNAASVTFTVSFVEWVANVDLTDFLVARTGTSEGTIATATPDSGTTFIVTVSNLAGDGTLRLDLKAGTNIQDAAGNVAEAYSNGEPITLDHTAPTASFAAVVPDPRNTPAGAVDVSFNESVAELDVEDFRLTRNGAEVSLGGLTVTALSDSQYAIDLSTVSAAAGAYVLTFVAADSGVRDLAGNPVAGDAATAFVVHPWQNVVRVCDVNDDSAVTPIDALFVINEINFGVTGPILFSGGEPPFVDVNGDDALTATDVLAVINFLNRRSSDAEGEAEATFWAGVSSWRMPAEPEGSAMVFGPMPAAGHASTLNRTMPRADWTPVAGAKERGHLANRGPAKGLGADGVAGRPDRTDPLEELDELLDILAPAVANSGLGTS